MDDLPCHTRYLPSHLSTEYWRRQRQPYQGSFGQLLFPDETAVKSIDDSVSSVLDFSLENAAIRMGIPILNSIQE